MNSVIRDISAEFKKLGPVEGTVLVLAVLFIIMDVAVPRPVADLVDTTVGKLLVILGAVMLLFYDTVLGAVAILVAFELIRRSESSTGTQAIRKYLPTQAKKDAHLSAFNQFPRSLEEEVVAKMVPYVSYDEGAPGAGIHLNYKPTMDNIHDAAMLQ
jgi:hypothetical protein